MPSRPEPGGPLLQPLNASPTMPLHLPSVSGLAVIPAPGVNVTTRCEERCTPADGSKLRLTSQKKRGAAVLHPGSDVGGILHRNRSTERRRWMCEVRGAPRPPGPAISGAGRGRGPAGPIDEPPPCANERAGHAAPQAGRRARSGQSVDALSRTPEVKEQDVRVKEQDTRLTEQDVRVKEQDGRDGASGRSPRQCPVAPNGRGRAREGLAGAAGRPPGAPHIRPSSPRPCSSRPARWGP